MSARVTPAWTSWTVALLLSVPLAPHLLAQCSDELGVSGLPSYFYVGRAIAFDGDAVVVGATPSSLSPSEGSIQFYARNGTSWTPTESFASSEAQIGKALAMEGEWAVAGTRFGETTGIYRNSGTGWFEHTMLLPDSERFSDAVAISGNTVVIGSEYEAGSGPNWNAGGAYVFVLQGGAWVRETLLFASDGADNDRLGESVSISGDTVVVGAPSANKAYVFVRTGNTWSQQARLDPDAPLAHVHEFASSVAVEGDTVLVGSYGDDEAGPDAGAVYVFVRTGNTWQRQQKLTAGGARFLGGRVALSGGVAAASGREPSGAGSLHLFSQAISGFAPTLVLTAPVPAENDGFGSAVDISGAEVAAGALGADSLGVHKGTAFVFELLADFQRYCLSTPNSTGSAASITIVGCESVAQGALSLHSGPVPDSPGIFFYGSTPIQIPFGNGFRCVLGSVTRSEFVFGSGGTSTWLLDPSLPPHDQITAGSTWRFQHWFRDPMGGGSLFDLSDAVSVMFLP